MSILQAELSKITQGKLTLAEKIIFSQAGNEKIVSCYCRVADVSLDIKGSVWNIPNLVEYLDEQSCKYYIIFLNKEQIQWSKLNLQKQKVRLLH